jgi:hypothetical protein
MKLKTIAPLVVLLLSTAALAADGGYAPLNVLSCPAL